MREKGRGRREGGKNKLREREKSNMEKRGRKGEILGREREKSDIFGGGRKGEDGKEKYNVRRKKRERN